MALTPMSCLGPPTLMGNLQFQLFDCINSDFFFLSEIFLDRLFMGNCVIIPFLVLQTV